MGNLKKIDWYKVFIHIGVAVFIAIIVLVLSLVYAMASGLVDPHNW